MNQSRSAIPREEAPAKPLSIKELLASFPLPPENTAGLSQTNNAASSVPSPQLEGIKKIANSIGFNEKKFELILRLFSLVSFSSFLIELMIYQCLSRENRGRKR